jgi:hypothetical protein
MTVSRRIAQIVSLGIGLSVLSAAQVSNADDNALLKRKSEYRFYAGARHPSELLTADVLSGGRLALRGIDVALENEKATTVGVIIRSLALVAIDLPILSFAVIIPHEAFGHAARYREFDGRPTVHFDLPLPYSLEAEHFVTNRPTRTLYLGERSVTSLAGLQAQEASQRMLTLSVFRSGTMRRGDAMIYGATSLTHVAQTFAGADLKAAASVVRPLYGTSGDADGYLTLARGALILDAVDPMFLASLYYGARYGLLGEQVKEAPHLKLGGARWFVSSRTMPVPWGVEHQLHVLAGWDERDVSVDLGVRTGVGARESLGVEANVMGPAFLFGRVMRLGVELAAWTQPLVSSVASLGKPRVFTFGGILEPINIRDRTTTGGAARLLIELDRRSWFLGTRLGYKSLGLWGERALDEGFDVAMTGGVRIE